MTSHLVLTKWTPRIRLEELNSSPGRLRGVQSEFAPLIVLWYAKVPHILSQTARTRIGNETTLRLTPRLYVQLVRTCVAASITWRKTGFT